MSDAAPIIAGLQFAIAWEDKPANFAAVDKLLDDLSPPPDSLIALPEMFATGFSFDIDRIAEGEGQPVEKYLARTAELRGITFVGGVVRRDARTGKGLNQAVVFSPRGDEVARYSKLHPFTFSGEADHYTPGSNVVTLDWQGVTVAPLICYDLRFPEAFRAGVRRGVEVFVVIANWPELRHAHWRALLIARAIENQAYVLGVNRTGSDPKLDYAGGSLIVDPRGEVIAEGRREPQAVSASIDIDALRDYRRTFPVLPDMRGDLLP